MGFAEEDNLSADSSMAVCSVCSAVHGECTGGGARPRGGTAAAGRAAQRSSSGRHKPLEIIMNHGIRRGRVQKGGHPVGIASTGQVGASNASRTIGHGTVIPQSHISQFPKAPNCRTLHLQAQAPPPGHHPHPSTSLARPSPPASPPPFTPQPMAVGVEQPADGGPGIGKPIQAPSAWTRSSALARQDEWLYTFTPADQQEILAATRVAVASGKPVPVRVQPGRRGGEVAPASPRLSAAPRRSITRPCSTLAGADP